MNHSFEIKIAEVMFRITFNDRRLFNVLKKYFYPAKSNSPAEFEIFVKKNYKESGFKVINNRKVEIYFPNGKLTKFRLSRLHYAVVVAAGYLGLTKNFFFLHASAFVKNNKAYIFAAPSGGGKTTIIKRINRNQFLADDVVIIKKIKNQLFVYSSPFEKKATPSIREKVPIVAIYFLHQSKNNAIKNLYCPQSLKRLVYNHIFFPFGDYGQIMNSTKIQGLLKKVKKQKKYKKNIKLLFRLAIFITQNVPGYDLFFTKDIDFRKGLNV